jgi:hypothetical protein
MAKSPRRYVEELTKRSSDLLLAYGPSRLSSEVAIEIAETIAGLGTPEERTAGRISRTGRDAGEFMEAALKRWTTLVTAQTAWSGAKSLYLARRVPMDVLARIVMGVDASDRALTSCIVGTERLLLASFGDSATVSDEVDLVDGTVVYRVNDDELLSFMRRVVATSHLWLMHNTARIVGKGCDLVVRAGQVPEAVETPALRHALDLYDERSAHGDIVGIAGTQVWRETAERTITTIALCGHRDPLNTHYGKPEGGVRDLPSRFQSDPVERDPIRPTHIALPFELKRFDLAPLGQLTHALDRGDANWYEPELPGVLALLHAVDLIDEEVARFQIEHTGYLRMSRERLFELLTAYSGGFAELVTAVLPGADPHPRKLMSQLLRVQGCVYPTLDGPIVMKATGGELLVDLVSASRRVAWQLTLTSHGGGKRGQARGDHFELLVRSEIERAGFGPKDPALAEIVGRQLKRDGVYITDIDAIAEVPDGTLLLVSAKSYPYTPEYASGRYAAVNAVTSRLLKDIAKWEVKMQNMLASPAGRKQNFRLPPGKYVGILVTPFAPFVPVPECDMEAMPGLRRTGSLKELTDWLRTLSHTHHPPRN